MKTLKSAAAGALLLLASAAVQAGAQPADRIAPGEGAVLMTIAVDYPSVIMVNAAVPQLIPDLSVERLDDPQHRRYLLEPRLDGLQSARAYAGSLPAGRYRVHDLMGSKCKLFCGDGGWLPQAKDLPEFDVVAGEVSYLGTIIAKVEPILPGKKFQTRWAYEPTPDPALGQRLLDGLYPELAGAKPALGVHWQPFAAGAEAAAAARARLRGDANGQFEFTPWGGDGFCFGAQHGMVKCWNRAAGFQLVDTGAPYVMRSLVRLDDGRMLAAGEATTLRYSKDGATWSDASAGLPWGVVAQVESIGGDEVVFTVVSGKTVRLYRGRIGEHAWTRLGEYEMEFATWTGMPGAYPELVVQGRKLALTLPSKKGVVLDLDSGESHPITPPGSIAMFSYSADGVMRCACVRSIAVNPWDSRDEGRTWQSSTVDRWMVLPVFRNELEGFTFKGAWLSAKNTAVVATKDGGKTWTPLAKPAGTAWWRPAYSHDGSVMVLVGMNVRYKFAVEEVQVSADEGKTWTQVGKLPSWLPEAAGPAPAAPGA